MPVKINPDWIEGIAINSDPEYFRKNPSPTPARGLFQQIPSVWPLTKTKTSGKMDSMNMEQAVGTARKSAGKHFPYRDSTVAYLVAQGDRVYPVAVNESTYKAVVNAEGSLYAVWPGKHKSDLFKIDKVELVKAFE